MVVPISELIYYCLVLSKILGFIKVFDIAMFLLSLDTDYIGRKCFDSKIQSTHDSSSLVRSYPNKASSKVSEFCSQSVIGSARSLL